MTNRLVQPALIAPRPPSPFDAEMHHCQQFLNWTEPPGPICRLHRFDTNGGLGAPTLKAIDHGDDDDVMVYSQPAPTPVHRHRVTKTTTPTQTATIEWLDQVGIDRKAIADSRLLDRELFLAQRSRTGNRYPKQRNYHGLTWFAGTGKQVWHESLFERYALLTLDFRHDIVALAVQPMTMTFDDGSEHYPDFIALHSDHRQVVYDVKPASRVGAKAQRQFDATEALCRRIGWGYEVFSDPDRQVRLNVEWVANFRNPAFAPEPVARQQLLAAAERPLALHSAAQLMRDQGWNGGVASAYHLVWTGELTIDLTEPLSTKTLVRKALTHAHA
jgi:hypothetical protein